MPEVSGDFEIHVTAQPHATEALSAFAARHGLKFVHIVLDRGAYASQPMLTVTGRGTLAQQEATAQRWHDELRAAGVHVSRTKIEAAPWCAGVPRSDEQAAAEPDGRYFEHHVKLLLPAPTVAQLLALTDLVEPHGARLSRNARRERADGVQERFVTQRCRGVGLTTAERRLADLVAAVSAAGFEVAAVEQEYVVFDSSPVCDYGWLDVPQGRIDRWAVERENTMRSAPAGSRDFPPTYRPLPAGAPVRQRAAFDPALKHYPHAYRAGEPDFLVPATGERWTAGRRAALAHVLAAIAATPVSRHLVLRGSVLMAAQVGAAAREPGDVDFVVVPHTVTSDSADARALLDDVKAAIRYAPGAGLRPDRISEAAIWTYERADGRRLVVPFRVDGAPDGHVQIDVVFGEQLPLPPETVTLPGVARPVLGAPAELALAWKLMWLATDAYPQGKDLYDAVLLAETTSVDRDLVRRLMRPELGAEADALTAETVLTWGIDWENFVDEYPGVEGTAEEWTRRLALALERAWA
ncbi:nucleotidyl transferase AbiEii/AbiGii toxin family protein [Micromonospora chalcea]|uniref:nucleotidyl transferase AbiEii/AbiGii toxin family protein n=1 Tax=Micromonospora sp. TSRI0369 TaxID=1703936 RepID=UPI00093C6724|nr:nucleotidyl transferase AbiEii/AbiGii toxin family protein [Micromonospora sp. TSRI0369]OKJ46190.1 ankyrin [Micromonospora sp. TSRI0369]